MDIFKIVALGVAAMVFVVLIKDKRPELAIQLSLIAAGIIFLALSPYLETVINMFRNISKQIGINSFYITVIIKVIGIAYAAQFGAELCRDAGETAIASKIELAGKIIIMTLSMPIIYKLLEIVEEILKFR